MTRNSLILLVSCGALAVFLLFQFKAKSPAGVELSLGSGSGAPGETVALALVLTAPKDAHLSALQWTLDFSSADFAKVMVAAGPSATEAGLSVSCNGKEGVLTCAAFGLARTTVNNGAIAILNLTIARETQSASSTVRLSRSVASSVDAESVAINTNNGSVTITPRKNPAK